MENKKPTIQRSSSYESLGEEFPNFQDTAEYDDIQNAIIEKLKLVFWDNLQDDIKQKKYDKLLSILNDVKIRICDLIPNRKDLHKNIADTIDTELIEQMIKHNAIDNNYIFNIIQFIITQLKELDTLRDEPFYEIWREQINRKLMSNESNKLHVILPIFLRETLHRIDKIAFEISVFKESHLYKSILEKRKQNQD
tara:strand:+ start:777 stop:1361 length:585 start_codon:yes stop_codon:yes gene_type:complete